MAAYRNFSDVPGLQVELEDTGGSSGDPSLADALAGVRAVAALVATQLGSLPAEQCPTDLSLTFGLRAVSGGFAVGLDADTANIRVSLTWSQEPAAPEPEVPVPGL